MFRPEEIETLMEIFQEVCTKGSEGSGYHFLVWVDGDGEEEIQGLICYGRRPMTRWSWDLYWLMVDPRARGRGIGTALLRAMEDHLRREGGRWILVETATSAPYVPARRFYARNGFRLLGTVEDFYEEGEGLAIYVKDLAPAGGVAGEAAGRRFPSPEEVS